MIKHFYFVFFLVNFVHFQRFLIKNESPTEKDKLKVENSKILIGGIFLGENLFGKLVEVF